MINMSSDGAAAPTQSGLQNNALALKHFDSLKQSQALATINLNDVIIKDHHSAIDNEDCLSPLNNSSCSHLDRLNPQVSHLDSSDWKSSPDGD
jgi:hypothetical protein